MPSNSFVFQVPPGGAAKPGFLHKFVVTVPGDLPMARQFVASIPNLDPDINYAAFYLGTIPNESIGPAVICREFTPAAAPASKSDGGSEFGGGEF